MNLNQLLDLKRQAAEGAHAGACQVNICARTLHHQQTALAKLFAQFDQLLSMEEEGVCEVTLRTPTQSIVLPLDRSEGSSLAVDLWEGVSKRMRVLEAQILDMRIEMATPSQLTGPDLSQQLYEQCMPAHAEAQEVPAIPFVPRQRPSAGTARPSVAATA